MIEAVKAWLKRHGVLKRDARFDCPVCCYPGEGPINIEKANFFVCERCGVSWYVGWNLFSSWRKETPADWERNRFFLSRFKGIE
ncbi:hypothetical protein [Desulfofundulus australicus]|uniref:hypothetical protein n=1 Tax=Desulfofundulus australicus TaxID=1566 RepID=UPI000934E692|nr:hypothetical protein [Desulfofundulus australicus]